MTCFFLRGAAIGRAWARQSGVVEEGFLGLGPAIANTLRGFRGCYLVQSDAVIVRGAAGKM
jgi:hypothetical protein